MAQFSQPEESVLGQDIGVNWEIMPPREVLGNGANRFDVDKQSAVTLGPTGVGPNLTPAEETDGEETTVNPGNF